MKDIFYHHFVEQLPSQNDNVVVITGTSKGIGYWCAIGAIRKNVRALFLLNRESVVAKEAFVKFQEERQRTGSNTEIISVDCDLMDFNSVKIAAKNVNEKANLFGGVNVLANNAGIMGFPDDRTTDGYDVQVQVNHLSHFLLTKELMPSFQLAIDSGGEVRIVQETSGIRNVFSNKIEEKYFQKCDENTLGGNNMYRCLLRYHQSKLAATCVAFKLDREFVKNGWDTTKIKSIVADPGAASETLRQYFYGSHKNKERNILFTIGVELFEMVLKINPKQTPADGAMPMLHACFGKDVESGDFFYPENVTRGKPIKAVSHGKVMNHAKGGKDRQSLSHENQDLVWKVSQEAAGGDFFSNSII